MTVEQTTFEFPDPDKELENKNKGATEDIEIDVVDDTPPVDRGRKPMDKAPEDPTEEELKSYSADAQKRIKHFTKGYHEERRAKEAAARERDEAVRAAQAIFEENKRLKGTLNDGQTALVETTQKALETEIAHAKAKLKEAQDSFDTDKVIEAQEELFEAKIKLDRVKHFKPSAGQKAEDEVKTPQSAQPRAPVQPDQKALAWQQRNPWFGADAEMTSLVLGLHKKLIDEGIDTRSDDYYRRIDARVRKLFPENFEEMDEVDTKPSKSSPVAPASRTTAPKKITLTQSQVAIAKKLGVSLQDYAKQVALEQRNQNG